MLHCSAPVPIAIAITITITIAMSTAVTAIAIHIYYHMFVSTIAITTGCHNIYHHRLVYSSEALRLKSMRKQHVYLLFVPEHVCTVGCTVGVPSASETFATGGTTPSERLEEQM